MAPRKSDAEKAMQQLATASKDRAKLRKELQRHEDKVLMPLILKAVGAGVTLREIGEVVGVSHVTVMRMLERHRSS